MRRGSRIRSEGGRRTGLGANRRPGLRFGGRSWLGLGSDRRPGLGTSRGSRLGPRLGPRGWSRRGGASGRLNRARPGPHLRALGRAGDPRGRALENHRNAQNQGHSHGLPPPAPSIAPALTPYKLTMARRPEVVKKSTRFLGPSTVRFGSTRKTASRPRAGVLGVWRPGGGERRGGAAHFGARRQPTRVGRGGKPPYLFSPLNRSCGESVVERPKGAPPPTQSEALGSRGA